jgi:hypothetical protein
MRETDLNDGPVDAGRMQLARRALLHALLRSVISYGSTRAGQATHAAHHMRLMKTYWLAISNGVLVIAGSVLLLQPPSHDRADHPHDVHHRSTCRSGRPQRQLPTVRTTNKSPMLEATCWHIFGRLAHIVSRVLDVGESDVDKRTVSRSSNPGRYVHIVA